ncbi:NOL1/NOP2/sun family putative RNA methylase [Caloramator sp. E03]|uniref:RsmF rRNA methyltransferase first C-terminal domain-containing protein n=1 Tax=Caloramator sp. E03 TaxID=2576307 RepID=UPI0011101A58|nr:RsmF rRNA methyltransferase first C-terminal domain-containing protein [Caloramator sp. E03]QCX34467.1 NOL1/NOP2/sun family putative RNA methylase [Caloramator sp. E03]
MKLSANFFERMKFILKDEYDSFLESLKRERVKGIRVNTLKIDIQDFKDISPFDILETVPWEKRGFYINEDKPGKHPYHQAGLYYIQEPSAMAVVPTLNINEGDKVLDLCAAPGGKSTQAACYLNESGLIVCNEIEGKRAKVLSENIERMGIKNAIVTNNSPKELEKVFKGYFDKIIVDAPCSGEGMFKKEEAAIEDWSIENVEGCAARQREIMDCAATMVKPGGYIVYSTCTFSIEENEGTIDYFLKKHKEFEIVEIKKEFGFTRGLYEYFDNYELSKAARLFPHRLKGEGHFIALLRKKDGDDFNYMSLKSNVKQNQLKDYFEFEKENLNTIIKENFYLSGENLYSFPSDLCDLKGLRILRLGLHIGSFKKNRFEPNHALALAIRSKDAKRAVNFTSNSDDLLSYLKGDVIKAKVEDGWCLVLVDGYPIGWGKAVKGVIKNHFPKGLRW